MDVLDYLKYYPERATERVGRWEQYYAIGIAPKGRNAHPSWDIYTIRERDDMTDRRHFESGNYFASRAAANEALRWISDAEKFREWKNAMKRTGARIDPKPKAVDLKYHSEKDILQTHHQGIITKPRLQLPNPSKRRSDE